MSRSERQAQSFNAKKCDLLYEQHMVHSRNREMLSTIIAIYILSGTASWSCNPETLSFEPLQPIRTGCIPDWLVNVEMLANTFGSDPRAITGLIQDHTNNFEDKELQLTSGSLYRLIRVG